MQFAYFTRSDNHYADNRRGANQLIADIRRATAGAGCSRRSRGSDAMPITLDP